VITAEEIAYSTQDGLILRGYHWRGGSKTPIICIHGLTRNAKDFEEIAPIIANDGHDVIAISLRGRGRSDYDPDWRNYHPLVYKKDILTCLDHLNIHKAIYIGTSLGGIITMLIAEANNSTITAAIINDVGIRLAEEGLIRIGSYVGRASKEATSLEECANRIKAINQVAFPDVNSKFWMDMAKRTFVKNDNGAWSLDYDPNIAKALNEIGLTPDLEPGWRALSTIPTLLIRGSLSDLLSTEIIAEMNATRPGFDYIEIDRVGHAPMLTEPQSINAIRSFLSKIN